MNTPIVINSLKNGVIVCIDKPVLDIFKKLPNNEIIITIVGIIITNTKLKFL